VDDVSKSLSSGKYAVVAEIEESWTTPVDTRLHKLDGIVFRRLRGEVVADQLVREGAALEADLKALNDDLKQAAAENRAAVQKDIERVKKQIKVVQDQAKVRLDQAKAETDAKVKALQGEGGERHGQGTDRKARCCRQDRLRCAIEEAQPGLGPNEGSTRRIAGLRRSIS
jgi:hypothetical protein